MATLPVSSAPAQFGFGTAGLLNSNGEVDANGDGPPSLATDGAGNVVAVWSSLHDLTGTIGTDNDILVQTSSDHGVTWSAAAVLNSTAFSDTGADVNPVVEFGNGVWIAVWRSGEDLGSAIGTDVDLFVSRSTDNGASWSAAAVLNSNAGVDSVDDETASIATDGAGNWIASWASGDSLGATIGNDKDILVSRSTDGGVNWTAAAALATNAGSDSGSDTTPVVAHLSGSTWAAVYVSADSFGGTLGTDTDLIAATTTDGGATWSAPTPVNHFAATDTGSISDIGPFLQRVGASDLLAVWSSNFSFGGTIGNDFDVLASSSSDAGLTWSTAIVVNGWAGSDSDTDFADSLATDSSGNVLVAITTTNVFVSGIGTDLDMALLRSTDGGAIWSSPELLNSYGAGDTSVDDEPFLLATGGTNWVAAWQTNNNLTGTSGTDGDVAFATSALVPVELSGFGLE
jgi:hypothetical protein